MNTKVRAFRTTLASAIAISLAAPPSLVFASNAAPAGDTARAESLNAEAVDAFERKDYEESIRLFKAAYDANPEPNYLFNIGRVYEEKGDLENAVKFYQQFVGQAGVDLEARETALQRLKILRDALDQMKAEEEKGQDTPDDPPEDTTTDDPTQPTEPVDDGTASRKKKLRIAGYSLMGVGGAALIIGGVFGGLAMNKNGDADEEEFVDRAAELRSEARTQARVADAMFITGGILAAGGLVLVLVTLGKAKGSATAARALDRRTAVVPQMGRGRIGVGLTHRF